MRRLTRSVVLTAVLSLFSLAAPVQGTILSNGDYIDYPDAVYSDNGSWVLASTACVFNCPGGLGPSVYLLMHNVGGNYNNWVSYYDSAMSGSCGGTHTSQAWPAWPARAIMQSDGNFVLYSEGTVEYAAWSTGTNGNSYAYLSVQDDGNLVVYNSSDVPIWYTQC